MHRRRLISLLWAIPLAFAAVAAQAAGKVPRALRDAILSRTVSVRSEGDTANYHASGFVWGQKGKTSYIVTAFHPGKGPNTGIVTVSVFPGTKHAKDYEGKLVLYDFDSGLAVISVRGASLPAPFPFHRGPLKAGTPIYTGSVPLPETKKGKLTKKRAKANTMYVGAMRKSRLLTAIQVDGTIPPGGEGGPVVLANGRLVGISYIQFAPTLIGMALPVSYTQLFVSGKPGPPEANCMGTRNGDRELSVSVPMLDLKKRVKSCTLHFLSRADAPLPTLPEDGNWRLLRRDMVMKQARVGHPKSWWRSPVKESGLLPGTYWVQARTLLSDGTYQVSPPTELKFRAPMKLPPPSAKKPPVKTPVKPPPPRKPTITSVRTSLLRDAPPLRIERTSTRRIGGYDLSGISIRPHAKQPGRQPGGGTSMSRATRNGHVIYSYRELRPSTVAWSGKGDTLYMASPPGVTTYAQRITRISLPEGAETARLFTSVAASRIHPTRSGLVAVYPGLGLLLIDARTLVLRGRLSLPGIADLLVSDQGNLAIAVSLSGQLPSHEKLARGHFSGEVSALHVVNLRTWLNMRTYYCTKRPLGADPSSKLLGSSLQSPCALTADASHLVASVMKDGRKQVRIYPFYGGTLRLEKAVDHPLDAVQLVPRPGGSTILAMLPYQRWSARNARPDGAAANGDTQSLLFDPVNPARQAIRHWGPAAAVSANRLFVYSATPPQLRLFGPDGKVDVGIPLPRAKGNPTAGVRAIWPAPETGRAFLTIGRAPYLLEPATGAPPKIIVPGAKPEVAFNGRTLVPVTTNHGCLEHQSISLYAKKQLAPFIQANPAGNTVYALSREGTLSRVDLATMQVTHEVKAGEYGTGLCFGRAGVVVAASELGALGLRLHDPDTLELRQTWPLPNPVQGLVTTPATDTILMTDDQKRLLVFDAASGRVLQTYAQLPVPPDTPPPTSAATPPSFVLSQDGTLVFATDRQRLLRLRLQNGELVPDAITPPSVLVTSCVALDEAAGYVGVIGGGQLLSDFRDGWGPRAAQRQSLPNRPGKPCLAVLDAKSLVPLYHVDSDQSPSFVFDRSQSQLVTSQGLRYFPDGTCAVNGMPKGNRTGSAYFAASENGWFIRAERGGISRFRFANHHVPAQRLQKQFGY